MGKYQAWIAAGNTLGNDLRVGGGAHGSLAPRVVFTDPQVAAVEHTLVSAVSAPPSNRDVIAVDHPTGGVAGGSFYGRQAAGAAVVAEVPVGRLRYAVPAFPTRSEVWLRLLQKYEAVAAAVSNYGTLPAAA